ILYSRRSPPDLGRLGSTYLHSEWLGVCLNWPPTSERVGRHSRVRLGESPLVWPELRRTSNSPEDFLGISRDEGCAGYPKKIPSSADSACLRQKHSDPRLGRHARSHRSCCRDRIAANAAGWQSLPGTKSNHLPCILRNPRHPRAPGAHSSFTGNEVWHGSSQHVELGGERRASRYGPGCLDLSRTKRESQP